MAKGQYRNRGTQPQPEAEQEEKLQEPAQESQKDTLLDEMARLDFENQMAHEKAGKEAPTYGFWGWVYRMQKKYGDRPLHRVDKKKYILLAIFTGWMGGHRFYEKRYLLAAFYLLFCWTLVPLTMVVIDLMIVLPKQADAEGKIEL